MQSLAGIFHALFCRGYFCVFLHKGFLRTVVAGNFSLISFPAFCPSGFSLGLFACSFWQGFFRCAPTPGLFPSILSWRRFPCDFSLRFSLLRSTARASSMHSPAGVFSCTLLKGLFQCALSKGFSSVSTYIKAFSVHSFTRGLPCKFSQWFFPCAISQGFSSVSPYSGAFSVRSILEAFSSRSRKDFSMRTFARGFYCALCLWRFFLAIFCCFFSVRSFAVVFPVMLIVAGSSSVTSFARFFPVFASTVASPAQFLAEVFQVQSFIGFSSVQSLAGVVHALLQGLISCLSSQGLSSYDLLLVFFP